MSKIGALLSGIALLVSLSACSVGIVNHGADVGAVSLNVEQPKKVKVFLVGDSTMATGSGYGDRLCAAFVPEVTCINAARGGRSSASYRAEGLWTKIMEALTNEDGIEKIVLIQFGHNDQPGKPGRSTDLATEFPRNLEQYIVDVKHAGGIPILVTPLTRRSFINGLLQNDLRPWAQSAIDIAVSQQVGVIDLNLISFQIVQKMGQAEADTLAMAPPPDKVATPIDTKLSEKQGAAKSAFDRTHVGQKGAELFSALVLQQLLALHPELKVKSYVGIQP